jgi:crotonobetainyl-CoA:carnitine CoA-transferase CaiB-like acyl-CoA transferase
VRIVRPTASGIEGPTPGWDDALVAGKERLVCDLKADPGHDLNYLGWAGALAKTGPGMPPLPFADFSGVYRTVAVVLAGLLAALSSLTGKSRVRQPPP